MDDYERKLISFDLYIVKLCKTPGYKPASGLSGELASRRSA
jgi:hypothetical protein